MNLDVARNDRIKRDSYRKIIDMIVTKQMENQVYVEIDCTLRNIMKWLWYNPNLAYEFANVANEDTFYKILPFAKILPTAIILNRDINPHIVNLAHRHHLRASFWTAQNKETLQEAIDANYDIIGCELNYNDICKKY